MGPILLYIVFFIFLAELARAHDLNIATNNSIIPKAIVKDHKEENQRGILPASKHSRANTKLLRRWLGHTYAVMMINTKNLAATSSELHVTRRMQCRYVITVCRRSRVMGRSTARNAERTFRITTADENGIQISRE